MTASLRILIGDSGPVLKIPNQALRFRPDGKALEGSAAATGGSATVWVIGADGQPEPVSIMTGLSDITGTQVLLGSLTEGQQVIVGTVSSTRTASLFGFRFGF
jgi:HlyD family secretion protein